MPIEYKVQPGDCISSIAFVHGFSPATIWHDGPNASLRERRKNPNTLLPDEDVVHIRNKELRHESAATSKRWRYRRLGVPEMLRVRFVDFDGKPRTAIPFEVQITGGPTHKGVTDGDGSFAYPIQPDAATGMVVLSPEGAPEERYRLALGYLRPADDDKGIVQRLANLGFFNHHLDLDEETIVRVALYQFQESIGLAPTGEPDGATLEALRNFHGS